jgi:imidazolonepropionase
MEHFDISPDAVLVDNCSELITMAPLAERKPKRGLITAEDLGCLQDAWLLIDQGRVIAHGNQPFPAVNRPLTRIDAGHRLVMPGLVDSHTHPVFGGDRSREFAQRLDGASYQDIAQSGGGIRSTVAQTRAATDADLKANCQQHLQRFLEHGVTTVEVKTGYGQTPEEEYRQLRMLHDLKQTSSQELSVTYLGLHVQPKEFTDTAAFVDDMSALLERLASEGLAEWVDAFVEQGYFPPEVVEPFMAKAQQLGFKIRIHADEFQDSQAAAAAARWGAFSADHLEEAQPDGLQAMARQGTVAVLLPGTSLYTKIPFTRAQTIRDAGCLMALASDFNPGSCQIDNLPMLTAIGALHCGLSAAEAIAAVTYSAAVALDRESQKGCLNPGYDADFVIQDCQTKDQWLANLGQKKPRAVYIAGKKQWPESSVDS